ncbi:RDD family protein [Pararhizobium sp. DWP3-4]|uniref:RDD family protein n=1 Tax=Pararhizobium sp. DWP3-4 TaxID=2804565 RepID=UPI003CF0A664
MTASSASRYADGPQRLFWRRGLAFIIDNILFYIAISAVLLVVSVLSPWNIGVSTMIYTECRPAPPSPLVAQVDSEWPLEFGLERTNTLCRKTFPFDRTGYVFTSTTTKTKGLNTWSKWVTVASDENGAPLPPGEMRSALLSQILTSSLPLAAIIGLFIYFTTHGRRTPGKRFLRLKVMTPHGIAPGLPRAARRELLKFAPLMIGSIASIATTVHTFLRPDFFGHLITQSREMSATNLPLSAVLVIGCGIGQLLWWLLPFLSWRGQTYYDRIAGCTVVRQDRPSSRAAG